jgi:hypothetical protein
MTNAVNSLLDTLPSSVRWLFIEKIRSYNDFRKEGDDDHRTGTFEFDGDIIVWHIEYFDREYNWPSSDPADYNETKRVLMVKIANEL